MAQVSYIKKVRVSADGATNWLELPCNSPTLDFGGDVLDNTNMKDLTFSGYRSMQLGLHTWSVGCDSFYDSNTNDAGEALALVRNAKMNRGQLFVQYLPNGVVDNDGTSQVTKGFQGEVVVENFNLSGGISDLENTGITLQGTGELKMAIA